MSQCPVPAQPAPPMVVQSLHHPLKMDPEQFLAQFDDPSLRAPIGPPIYGPPHRQFRWMLGYLKSRYGTDEAHHG